VTRERWKDVVDIFAQKGIKLLSFSAATGEGVPEVLRELIALIPASSPADEESVVELPEERPS